MWKLIFILFIPIFGFSQTSKIKTVQLAKPQGSTYPFAQVEPSIAIHPKNQNIQIAGSVMDDYYYSTDGGDTWTSNTLTSKFGVGGDPVLIFDSLGRAYYFHLSNYSWGSYLDRMVCQYTDDVSSTFSAGSHPLPAGKKVQDKQWVCVDPVNNHIYMTWTQFDTYNSKKPEDSTIIVFSKSEDQGVSWSDPIRISKYGGNCRDDNNTVEGAVPTVGRNGEIFVVWTGPKGLVMQKSTDKGSTWLPEEKRVHEHHGGWNIEIPGFNRANGLPILTSDHSKGENHGNLYLNWCDRKEGNDNSDSWLCVSKDEGTTWSEPVKVNQDKGMSHQFFTWMTVDQSTGYLYFVYYDRRDEKKKNRTHVYAACSKDGGRTFTEIRLTKKPFIPNSKKFFGDYLNIAAVNGTIRAIYPRMDKKEISLWVAHIPAELF
jgi:BNR repeat-like domain